jgi:hypothetical protein
MSIGAHLGDAIRDIEGAFGFARSPTETWIPAAHAGGAFSLGAIAQTYGVATSGQLVSTAAMIYFAAHASVPTAGENRSASTSALILIAY